MVESILERLPNLIRVHSPKDTAIDTVALAAFQARFHSEEACADYLIAQKWPNGFICSRCSHTTASRINTRRLPLLECGHCHYQASPTVDTIMENSSTDLRKWFTAMFLVSSTDSGITAIRLQAMIQVTYKTAWLMLRKIRQSITQADAAVKLTGEVYIDCGRCAPPLTIPSYNKPDQFPVLIGTATDSFDQVTYVKIQMVPKSHYNNARVLSTGIDSFSDKHIVSEAAVIRTIGTSTKRNAMKGYPIFQKAREWVQKAYHGLGQAHLQHYWNEYCWRLNTKLRNAPLFESMLRLCATTPSTTYVELAQAS